MYGDSETTVSMVETAPPMSAEFFGFLGSTGMAMGSSFDWQARKMLAEGPASIGGKVLAEGVGRGGVRLRLLLSGVRSSWTTSDTSGNYVVRVPPGKYRYHGYELDFEAASRELQGMLQRIEHDFPVLPYIDALPGNPGKGPDFDFVTAITTLSPLGRKIIPRNKVRLEWKAFSGAAEYGITLMESNVGGRGGGRFINDPTLSTSDTFFVIPDTLKLNPGKLYMWHVTAFNKKGDEISRSPGHRDQASFEIQ